MNQKNIESIYGFIVSHLDESVSKQAPSLDLVKKKFLTGNSVYKNKVLVVFNITPEGPMDTRTCVLLDKNDAKWWERNGDVMIEIHGCYGEFAELVESRFGTPEEIQQFLEPGFFTHNKDLEKELSRWKSETILNILAYEGQEPVLGRVAKKRKIVNSNQ
jgi:hypothetical protein